MRRVTGTSTLWHARDEVGRMLCRRGDGYAAMLPPGDAGLVNLVLLRDDALQACLAEAQGLEIRLGKDEAGETILPVRMKPAGKSTNLSDAAGRSLILSADGLLERGEVDGDTLRIILTPARDVPDTSLLARLCGRASNLTQIIACGDTDMIPAAVAMLQLLDMGAARRAWTSHTRTSTQDPYHPLIRAQAHRTVGRFPGYTADLLVDEIARYGWSIGAHSYGAPRILEAGRGSMLSIGRFCSMAAPTIVLGNHKTCGAASYPFMDLWSEWPGTITGSTDHEARDVHIGNDVWIGVGAILLPGCQIGDGAVVGAGSVVRGRIPPYGICVGNPAAVRNYRFASATVARLLCLRWWDWPDGKIDRFIPLLLDENIDAFIAVAEAACVTVPA